jgi:3-isopropylmalate/(R)-2-methylmalate dehydratase small subunit
MSNVAFSLILTGRVIKLGDHIDTDLIYPGRYVPLVDPGEWSKHALEGIASDFPGRINSGDIIVAGRNFGCGSSRSQAVSCLKLSGIAAITAVSFGRIFFRNCINQGLPAIQSPQAAEKIADGDEITLDLAQGHADYPGGRLGFEPLPDFLMEILAAGGLIPHTKRHLAEQAEREA